RALPLPLCPVKPLISGRSVLARRKAWGWNGSLPTTTNQRDYARLNLWPDRHRIHDGFRHYRHGELRPRRCIHGVEFHSARCFPAARQFSRKLVDRVRSLRHAHRGDVVYVAGQLDDLTTRLQTSARFVQVGATDLSDWNVYLPFQFRAGDTGTAQQINPTDGPG